MTPKKDEMLNSTCEIRLFGSRAVEPPYKLRQNEAHLQFWIQELKNRSLQSATKFAIDIWDFFSQWNIRTGCQYRYRFRLDEDSFLHSPISYDICATMSRNSYVYRYRMCAYEMRVAQRMWKWRSNRHPQFTPYRPLDLDMCGFYNNFFVADIQFFRSPAVAAFLRFIDTQRHIYRRRLGDLMIHSMAVYAFAPSEQIHRFLDFTYKHSALNKTTGCLMWGGIQAGWNDPSSASTVDTYYRQLAFERHCPLNMTTSDVSPTYNHLSGMKRDKPVSLLTITAEKVEFWPCHVVCRSF